MQSWCICLDLLSSKNSPDCHRDGLENGETGNGLDISDLRAAQCATVGPGKTIESTNTVLKQTDLMFGLKRR